MHGGRRRGNGVERLCRGAAEANGDQCSLRRGAHEVADADSLPVATERRALHTVRDKDDDVLRIWAHIRRLKSLTGAEQAVGDGGATPWAVAVDHVAQSPSVSGEWLRDSPLPREDDESDARGPVAQLKLVDERVEHLLELGAVRIH